jgi:Skp family chaperone for outer membrane proteins
MKVRFKLGLAVVAAFLLTGCDQLQGGSAIAVLDLAAVAKATGQDEVIRQQAEQARTDLSAQLQQVAANLEQQLATEREKAGIAPNEANAQRLQELTSQAQQQMNVAQQQAQQQAALIETNLVNEFRDNLDPIVRVIATQRGAKTVMAADAYMFWFDPEVDITDEVIAAWRAESPIAAEDSTEELEAVEEELAEVEEEIEELKEEIEELEQPAAE